MDVTGLLCCDVVAAVYAGFVAGSVAAELLFINEGLLAATDCDAVLCVPML